MPTRMVTIQVGLWLFLIGSTEKYKTSVILQHLHPPNWTLLNCGDEVVWYNFPLMLSLGLLHNLIMVYRQSFHVALAHANNINVNFQ